MKKKLGVIFKLTITVVAFIYVGRQLNIDAVANNLRFYDLKYIFLALFIHCSFFVVWGGRIRALSRGRVALTQGIVAGIIATGLNNLLPAKMGEAAKVFYLSRSSDITVAKCFAIVMWERFFDVNAALVILLLAMNTLDLPVVSINFLVMIIVLWSGLLFAKLFPKFSVKLIRLLPSGVLRRFLTKLLDSLTDIFSVRIFFESLTCTVLIWGGTFFYVYVIFVMVAGIQLQLQHVLLLTGALAIGLSIPSAPAALGVYEAIAVFTLEQFGVTRGMSLPASLLSHAVEVLPSVFGAVIVFFYLRLNPNDMIQQLRGMGRRASEMEHEPDSVLDIKGSHRGDDS